MWDTIHRGKSCKDMRRLDPHFKLLTAHRAPQSKHWITEAEQWSRGPTWMTLTQPNLLSVWSNFHKYWAKGIISLLANIWHQSLPHISQIPSSITECPQLAQRPLSHKPLLLPARFRSTTFSKSSRLASHPWSLACPVLSLKCGEYLEGSGCTQVARAD